MGKNDLLDKTYNREWMQDRYSLKPSHCEWAGNMVDSIITHMNPENVLDLGCGACNFANVLDEHGYPVLAVDGSKYAQETANEGVAFTLWDLREPIDLGMQYDLVLCVEVIEHIDAEFEDITLDTITNHAADWIMFTGAKPGQRGKGHVNCRELDYWETKLERRGIILQPKLTKKIQQEWREKKVRWWYVEGLIIGRRNNG